MKPIITVENLSKQYRVGAVEKGYKTLRESLSQAVTAPLKRLRSGAPSSDTIWALKDVNLEVMPGEVVGIVGRNGAGKSTLLKVLSRITEPTEGRIKLYGRVASLLEVGTGFHPELTGRENIFLNGAILGMSRREIKRNFDEIVAFSEVEKFIDTPVKRYSSGMYVRLAFAVAAHLESEVLVLDEVLAVGDASFQKKCLGKIGDVSRNGRTVLLVSHYMPSIQAFCRRAILMQGGQVAMSDSPDKVIQHYLEQQTSAETTQDLTEHPNRLTNRNDVVYRRLSLQDEAGNDKSQFQMGETITFELEIDSGERTLRDPLFIIVIEKRGIPVTQLPTNYMVTEPLTISGRHTVRCHWEPGWLTPGIYTVSRLILHNALRQRIDVISDVMTFEIVERDLYGTGRAAPSEPVLSPRGKWEFS
jgi:lipopolysaccharide transport system ATP-binding protein